ncbi:MAG: penicillin-binding protein 2 [Elusimicrobia bacterium RIFCSPHIGHO2_02_FULL_57_9]|nr:MAG: penicillin-binding protein 2 [Elusimicrobia bacterium RIFCSPHIGHO2_02_FULL_57_9]
MIQNHHLLLPRLNLLWALIYGSSAIMGLRLVELQILHKGEYRMEAERNRTQMIYQTAPRGRIYDRNGVALASNQPAFSLIYLPAEGKALADLKPLAEDLAGQINQASATLLETLQQAVSEKTAIRLAENLPSRTMFRLSELKTIYPGVDLIVEARRYYPLGRFASHLIGYTGKMDSRSWKELKSKGYRVDSRIGKMGLESVFERQLRGIDGGVRMEVDAQGRLKRILERIFWEPGSNIYLTLDANVQKAADEGLRKSATNRGAVVALDPRNGAILALSSAPDFDPNALLSSDPKLVKETFAGLTEFNHAIAGTYSPGSIFKPIVGAAGLNEARIDPQEIVFCPGYFELGKRIFLCWEHKGHKKMSWFPGLTQSCDVYFYHMGLKTGGALIEKYAKLFGLGVKTNIALKGEKSGNIFGPESRAKSSRSWWYDGDTVNLSIGQGELLVTPIQMAVVASAIANRGTLWRPHYTDRIEYARERAEYKQQPEKMGSIPLKDETWNNVQEAMLLAVSSGTARQAAIPGLDVRGKTGSAQNPSGDDHAWFMAYAAKPGELPSIAVVVLVENGGKGSSVAAPIAKEVILAAFGRTL